MANSPDETKLLTDPYFQKPSQQQHPLRIPERFSSEGQRDLKYPNQHTTHRREFRNETRILSGWQILDYELSMGHCAALITSLTPSPRFRRFQLTSQHPLRSLFCSSSVSRGETQILFTLNFILFLLWFSGETNSTTRKRELGKISALFSRKPQDVVFTCPTGGTGRCPARVVWQDGVWPKPWCARRWFPSACTRPPPGRPGMTPDPGVKASAGAPAPRWDLWRYGKLQPPPHGSLSTDPSRSPVTGEKPWFTHWFHRKRMLKRHCREKSSVWFRVCQRCNPNRWKFICSNLGLKICFHVTISLHKHRLTQSRTTERLHVYSSVICN